MRDEGAPFTNVGSNADEPMRAANACMGWGESAPIRANSAVADLGRPVSMVSCMAAVCDERPRGC